jgi:hypothetical protein
MQQLLVQLCAFVCDAGTVPQSSSTVCSDAQHCIDAQNADGASPSQMCSQWAVAEIRFTPAAWLAKGNCQPQ